MRTLIIFIFLGIAATGYAKILLTEKAIIMRNSNVEIQFNRKDLSLLQLRDCRRNVNYVLKPGGSLFHASFGAFSGDSWRTVSDYTLNGFNVAGYQFKKERDENVDILKLYYLDGIVNDAGNTADICITVSLPDDSPFINWQIAVNNKSGTPLKEVHFPLLNGLASNAPGSEKTDSVAVPLFCGNIWKNPRYTLVTGQEMSNYPMGSGLAFQMMYYNDGQGGGIYFAAHDAEDYHKTFACRPEGGSFRMFNIHYAETPPERAVIDIRTPYDSTTPFGKWELPYPIVTGLIYGDWYDACKVYRKWTLNHKRWTPLAERDDVSERFRSEVMGWMCLWGKPTVPITPVVNDKPNNDPHFIQVCNKAMDQVSDTMVALQNALGVKLGVHLYMWYKWAEMDYKYPDYFPALPGVKEGIAKMRAEGIAVMPYVNVLLFDSSIPQYNEAKKYFKKNLDGNIISPGPIGKGLYQGGGWGGMCFATEWWQDFITNVYRRLKDDYNCDAEYMDLLFSSQSFCFDKTHGHTIAGGNYFGKGGRAITEKVKKLRPKGESFIVGENTGETYIGTVDAFLVALPETEPTSIPMFETVYADRTNLMGLYYGGDSQLCFELVRGRMFWLAGAIDLKDQKKIAIWRNLLHTRKAALEFLYDGEFLRSPDVSGIKHIKEKWRVFLKNQQEVEFSIPVVFAEAYRSPEGAIGLVLANHTEQEQTVNIPWNARDWGFKEGTQVKRMDCTGGVWSPACEYTIGKTVSVTIPAKNAVVVKLAGEKPAMPILGAFSPGGSLSGPVSPVTYNEDARFNPDNKIYWSGN